ncbi:hypothetical protein OVS_04060 [Mycoplasma ovis str. Michigan]|uniref:Lipoprotein n=1 Tax=Mycoplasma ovis str. Michigan TaxID=1415773 RepID=A0ABN4BM83_9MOLU|nr:hypothetical protein [Mycoplasma ovis]AHC40543.1 hypothetical protein OVS_04060 [Mycoplasma ovis str. Michigan]
MSLLIKSYSCLLVGGGVCAAPFINSNYLSGSSVVNQQTDVTQETSGEEDESRQDPSTQNSEPVEEEKKGETLDEPSRVIKQLENCVVLEGQDQEVFYLLPKDKEYISLSCDNSGRGDEIINAKWKLWLSTKLLKEPKEFFNSDTKIDIQTSTAWNDLESIEDFYKTKFVSEIFSYPEIIGSWGGKILGDYSNWNPDDSQVYTVTIVDPKLEENLMYLKLKN